MRRYEHGGDIYGTPGVMLDFSVNTHPLGMPEEVRAALVAGVDAFSRYPDPLCRALRAAIARHERLPEDWVLCGNGAADLIYRLCFAAKPRRALICAPTFSEYERALAQSGCDVIRHALSAEDRFDVTEALCERLIPGIDILFLCHPNNPTGRLIPTDRMERILLKAREAGVSVVMDECFLDFTEGASSKRYLADMPGLVVLKAFTKIYAMAGLRLGYLLAADPALLDRVSAAAQCWSVSVPAQIAGMAALACPGWIGETRLLIAEERSFLSESLGGLGITVFPSDANFLLLRSGLPLHEPLLRRGILVRSCENFTGLDRSYCRIGIKTRAENHRLIRAVKEITHG